MGWIDDLKGETVALGTSPFIFFIEKHATYADVLRPFFQAVDRGESRILTSAVTLLEVLAHPIRHGDEKQSFPHVVTSKPLTCAQHQPHRVDLRALLEGLGAEIWKGIDPDEYVAKERDSWDG